MSEGGQELTDIPGRAFSASNSTTTFNVTTRRPVLTVQCKGTFNSLPNNTVVVPQFVSVVNSQGDATYALIEVIRNGTVTGPANTPFSDVDTNNSTMQYNTNGTTISGGQMIYAGYITSQGVMMQPIDPSSVGRNLLSYSSLLTSYPADTLSVVATSVAGTPVISSSIGWKEIR